MSANIPTKKTLRHNQGFTLIEIVITIVILGAVAGILVPFFNAIVHSPDPEIRERAISLGQAMMDEIMAKRWDENTPMGGGPIITTTESANPGPACIATPCSCTDRISRYACNNPNYTLGIIATPQPALPQAHFIPEEATRQDYDDVDDYDGWHEKDSFQDPTDSTKTFSMPEYELWVSVRYIASSNATGTIDQNTTAAPEGTTTDTKRVVITIKSPLGETFTFVAVACNI